MNKIKCTALPILFLAIIALASCSLKSGLYPEDTEARSSIRNSINDYSSEDWEVRLSAVKRASKYSDTVYAKNVILLMLLAADDYHPLVQIEAIKSLRNTRTEAAREKLRELALNDTDHNVRRTAITALQDYSDPENAEIFLAGIESSDWLIREASYTGLLRIKPDDIQRNYIGKIIKGMKDRNISVRLAVLYNLKIKDPLLYNEIAGIINNRKTGISMLKGALVAINGYTFDDRTRERLLDLLTHRNKDVRLLSLQALKREKIELNF